MNCIPLLGITRHQTKTKNNRWPTMNHNILGSVPAIFVSRLSQSLSPLITCLLPAQIKAQTYLIFY